MDSISQTDHRVEPAPPANGDLAAALAEARAREQQLEAAEAALRAREQDLARAYDQVQALYLEYKELFEFAPDGYVVTDAQGVIQEANQTAAALLGLRKEFLNGKPLFLFVTEGRKVLYECLALVQRGARPVCGFEVVLQAPRRRSHVVDMTVSVVGEGRPAPLRLRWTLHDVSARKQVESDLRQERIFAETLVENAQALILVVDAFGTIQRFNPAVRTAARNFRGKLAGDDWAAVLLPEEDRTAARRMVVEALGSVMTRPATFGLLVENGPPRTVAWSARPLVQAPGPPVVLLVGHDITELQRAQEQALQAERLAAIGKVMASLAHECRNALQRSQACLDRLGWKLADRPDALDLLARTQSAQEDLVRLFEDVRGFAAPLKLKRELRRLDEVWRDAWGQVSCLFPVGQARLAEETGGVDLECTVDRFRLAQVFRNVLENSFAACGGSPHVTITCQKTALDDRAAIQVSVWDNGPGLSPEQAQRIFEPFYTTKTRGTGLGMAIARRIVEAHGGRITVGESVGRGTVIVITLPRGRSEGDPGTR